MKKIIISSIIILLASVNIYSQNPSAKRFGFGIILGEPTGLTAKYWTTPSNAFDFSVGTSYFGNLRIGSDYLWHFNAFNSNIISLYAGPGAVIGFGESGGWIYTKHGDEYFVRKSNEAGLAARGIVGLNIIPNNTPLEIFGEFGILVGLTPAVGSNAEVAIGLRFYP